MSTQAVIGYGTLLKRGDGGSPEVFTAIAEVRSLGTPSPKRSDVDVTHLTSPGRAKEYIAGMIEQGEVSFKINWVPNNATHDEVTGLLANQIDGLTRNWQIVLPSSALIWTFPGYVRDFNPDDITPEKELMVSVTIKVAGASTFS